MLRKIFAYPQGCPQWYSAFRFYSKSKLAKEVKVQIRQGVVIGREELLPNGDPYHRFQGIPYAVPPVGELRFQPPVPLEHFKTPEIDCSRLKDPPPQIDRSTRKIIGSEDCLSLNVFAPAKSSNKPRPVMVWIHGGGFTSTYGQSFLPLSLMSEDVVFVSLNYRIGMWGFACLPEAGIFGNAGLKDQRLGLQWVQENIAKFNGDPNNVTLFGESAGAVSVHVHTLASHAHKTFHKAIIQSGVANAEFAFQRKPREKMYHACQLLGCPSKDPKEMRQFLQSPEKVTAEAVVSMTRTLLLPDERRRGPPYPLRPVIEDTSSPDAFISAPVLDLMRQVDTLHMPTIIGYCTGESFSFLPYLIDKLDIVDGDLARYVPRNFPFPFDHPEIQLLTQKVRDYYFGGHKITLGQLQNLSYLLSDYYLLIELRLATKMQAIYQPRAPIYAYRYDYTGERDIHKRMIKLEHLEGACHSDIICYLLQTPEDDPSTFAAGDALTTKRLSAMWANFARHGDPTPKDSSIARELGLTWTPVTKPLEGKDCGLDYLNIDRQCSMYRDPDNDRMQFWEELYSKYKGEDYSVLNTNV